MLWGHHLWGQRNVYVEHQTFMKKTLREVSERFENMERWKKRDESYRTGLKEHDICIQTELGSRVLKRHRCDLMSLNTLIIIHHLHSNRQTHAHKPELVLDLGKEFPGIVTGQGKTSNVKGTNQSEVRILMKEFTGRCYDYLLSCAPLNLIASTKVNSAFSFVLHYELEFDMAEQIPVFPHTLYVSYPDFPSRQILGARKSIFKLRPCSWHPPSSGTKVNLIPDLSKWISTAKGFS
ncbi:hypothetical protein MG293_013421 [Ovis ammon polii]|uniref:Uncharacterized protein n=1 Tax=Ovis ammon polii TaxID=230172 RepID=A0AAD4U1B2_OVIAM|nr:hypothetical protein MG293_013421 [Ovis ammon polii]KAI4557144.1 hypothetical protein MJT46_013823 [Ovis ammon polii x Ovis aries]